MPGFATGLLLLLLAALNCRNKVSLATKYVSEHRSYSDVTLGPRNFSDRSSEGEDDDWEEHHEWTYTELDDDDDDESGERKLANSGYRHYAGGLMGHYKGGAWSGSPKYNRGSASYYTGTAEGVATSRNEGRRIALNKKKSREALTAHQRSDSKGSQQRKESSYATNKSTKLFKSRAQNSTVNSTNAKFVRAGGGHFRGQALHVRKSPQTTVSSRNKGSGAGNIKRSYGAERNASNATGSGNKKIQNVDKLRSVASKDKKKNSSSTTSANNFGFEGHATRNSETFKRSYTANRKSTVAGTFIRKGDNTVKTYRRDKNHGVRKSLNSINFTGSHHNGRIQSPSGSRNSGRNKTGSFEGKHTVGKARTKGVFPTSKASKRYGNKHTSSSRANGAVRRKSSPWHTTESANTSERSFVTPKTTRKNVSKRNSAGNSNVFMSQKSTSGGRESAKTMVNKPSHQARENSNSNIISSTSENLEKRPRMKTSNSGNALLVRSNTNNTIQSSNENGTNAENRIKTVAEKTVGTRPPATIPLLGMEQLKSKTSTQRAIRDTSVAFSKSGIHSQRHAFDTSNGSKSTDVVLGHSSTSRLPNEGRSAGNADLRTIGHRHYLAYNESLWSGVGYPLVDNGFEYPRYRYLVSSPRRRKKGRAILRVHRIRRRRRKRKGRHKNAALPRAAGNVGDSSHGKLADDMHIRSVKTIPDRVTSPVQESSRNTQLNAYSDAVKSPAVASHVNRSKLEAPELRKTTTTTVLPHKPQTTQKQEVFVTESTTTSTKRPKVLRTYNPPKENVIVQRRKNLQFQEMPSDRVFSPTRKEVRLQIPRRLNAFAMPDKNITQRVREKDPLVRRHRTMHHPHRRPRCRSISAAHKSKAGKLVGGGLMWFPAASCVTSGLDWNSVHSTACLHQQIAFVHRYKVLAPPLHALNENYTPGFCGSYVPWRHVTPHHVTDLLYDGSIVSGLSLHRFGFINPGGYTFELLPHTGRLILVGVPFHRRALSLCRLEPATLGLLFTGTGPRDGSLGMHRLVQICDRLEDYARTNPDNLYWGFPTVSVRTMPVAVRVPEASTDAITPVLPIASESAEAFTQRVFTEPLALYPDAVIDYHETHTDFLEPVVFLANHVDRDVEYVDEDVVTPAFAEDMAVPVIEGHEAPVIEAAAETAAETSANDGMPTVIEMKNSVEYVHPVDEDVHTDFIAAPGVAVDANAPPEDIYDGADEKTDSIAYNAGLGVDDADPGYYQEVAEPVVHVRVQTLSFPAPAI